MSRAVVTIATGRYWVFAQPLINSLAENQTADRCFVLTDSADLLASGHQRCGDLEVNYLPCGALPWPYPTLMRYSSMLQYRDLFESQTSQLVYTDVDMRPVGDCSALFDGALHAIRHPGYWDKSEGFPHCDDPESAAYVPSADRHLYVCGGVQGGPTSAYLAAMEDCARAILKDLEHGIVARWHDESHWNRWVSDNRELVDVLGPEFCWPESWDAPADVAPLLLALDKDHHGLRGTKPSMREQLSRAKSRLVRGN